MFIPRDYQNGSDQALWNFLHTNPGKNPLIVMATGLGKSLCMAMAKWRMVHNYPTTRILNLTHVKELVEGNFNTFKKLWPHAPAGIYAAGLGMRDINMQITFCSIQSVAKRPATFGHIDIVFIDEAHRMSPNDATLYGRFLNGLRSRNPRLIVIGYTATPFRMKGGLLTEIGIFDEIVYDIGSGESFVWAIENGYLAHLIPADPGFQIDDTKLHVRCGEYIDSEASAAWREQGILERAIDYQIAIAKEQGRRCALNFCQSIEDTELVADMFSYKGYPMQAVHSQRDDRDAVLEAFKRGELWGVAGKDILTTGFDHPPIDLIGMLRLSRSPGLYVQMLGRGTRPYFVDKHIHDINTKEGRLASIAASPKQNCVARGSLVLTDRGEVPIEQVKISDRIWDGVEYVTHGGSYAKGKKHVITYSGLVATPDHKVWVDGGWLSFAEAARRNAIIEKGASNGRPVKVTKSSHGLLLRSSRRPCYSTYAMRDLSRYGMAFLVECSHRVSKLCAMLKSTTSSNVGLGISEMCCSQMPLHKYERQGLAALRRPWYKIQLQECSGNGNVPGRRDRSKRHDPSSGDRQDRQQRSLRGGQHTACTTQNKYEQPSELGTNGELAQISARTSGSKVCGRDFGRLVSPRVHTGADSGKVSSAVTETEREVWDIHNCGPRHRFTCQGLIVSNCLVLDFAGNTARLGPINYPRIPGPKGKGGGEPPVRTCHQCIPATYHHVSVKVCPHCGFEFPPPESFKAEASTEHLILKLGDLPKIPEPTFHVEPVHQMVCQLNEGRNGKKDTMKVTYRSGYTTYTAWVCLAHPVNNYGRRAAEDWWKKHGGQEDVPTTIDAALDLADQLRMPKFIRVKVPHKGYAEIVGYDFMGTKFNLPPELGGPPLEEPEQDPIGVIRPADVTATSPAYGGYYDDEIPF